MSEFAFKSIVQVFLASAVVLVLLATILVKQDQAVDKAGLSGEGCRWRRDEEDSVDEAGEEPPCFLEGL